MAQGMAEMQYMQQMQAQQMQAQQMQAQYMQYVQQYGAESAEAQQYAAMAQQQQQQVQMMQQQQMQQQMMQQQMMQQQQMQQQMMGEEGQEGQADGSQGQDPAMLEAQLLEQLEQQQQQQQEGNMAWGQQQQQQGGGEYQQGGYGEYDQMQQGYGCGGGDGGEYYTEEQQQQYMMQQRMMQQQQQQEQYMYYMNQGGQGEEEYYGQQQQYQQQQQPHQGGRQQQSSQEGGGEEQQSAAAAAAAQRRAARRSQWDQGAGGETVDHNDGEEAAAPSRGPRRQRREGENDMSWLDRMMPPFPAAATLVVTGLPPIATEGNIRGLFGREWITLGRVSLAWDHEYNACKGYAFCDVGDMQQAHYAVNSMNGLNADGVQIGVQMFKVYRNTGMDNWGGGKDGGKGGAAAGKASVAAMAARNRISLFIGGISVRTEERDIRELFMRHKIPVEVVDVAMDRDTGKAKGFAFCEMADNVQAQRAVRTLHGVELQGRSLTVEIKSSQSRPPTAAAPGPSAGSSRLGGGCGGGGGGGGGGGSEAAAGNTRLFVGNLSQDCTDDILRSTFREVGDVVNVRIVADKESGRSKGFGFVEFKTSRDVDQAIKKLQGVRVAGNTIRLAIPSAPSGPGGKGGPPPSAAVGMAARGVPLGSVGDKGCGKGGKGPYRGMAADRKRELFGSPSRSPSVKRSRNRSRSRRRGS